MIYQCRKEMYDRISQRVTKADLEESNETLFAFMKRYFEQLLRLPAGSITQISWR